MWCPRRRYIENWDLDKRNAFSAIVIGVSSGGIEALRIILPCLPADFMLPVIVVQHRHPTSDGFIIRLLNETCQLGVKEVDEKEEALPGMIYLAPADYHLMIEEDRTFSLSIDAYVKYARPSIDILFETAADVYGERLVGVILTGANSDGSDGIKKIKEAGGLTVVQDPDTCKSDRMPRAAMASAKIDHILALEEIGPFLRELGGGDIP